MTLPPSSDGRDARRLPAWGRFVSGLTAILVVGATAYHYRGAVAGISRFVWDVGPTDVRIGSFGPNETVSLLRPDGVELVGSVYRPEGAWRARILLVHGNTPLGRELSLYRLLGARLAERGYYVLAVDLAGFGDSGDPFQAAAPESPDIGFDVRVWLDWFERSGLGTPLAIVAHSGGGAPALEVGLDDERVAALALLGPPRRTIEVLSDPAQRDYFFERAQSTHRQVYGRALPDWYTQELWLDQALGAGALPSLQVDMERYAVELSGPNHKPVLLVDNEWESPADLAYLRDFHSRMSDPKEYLTVPESDHYFNTRALAGRVLYDAASASQIVSAIDRWIGDRASWSREPSTGAIDGGGSSRPS